jgi:outer membrane biosynthesis protein TonB
MMEPAFRTAIGISIALHSALIAPFIPLAMQRDRARMEKEIVIDYVVLKEPDTAKEEPVLSKMRETPKVEIVKKVEVKPAPASKEMPKKDNALKQAIAADAKKQAQIRSTKEYINYYQLIREKIRDRLKEHYRRYYAEGEANLVFILTSDGRLESSAIDVSSSTADRTLHDIALRSLRESAPFPAFPKALTLPKMTFNLQVSFKRE